MTETRPHAESARAPAPPAPPARRLSELAGVVVHTRPGSAGDPLVASITHDSRAVKPGALFVALPGALHDGRTFIADAVRRGAVAALGAAPPPAGITVPYVAVDAPRHAAACLATELAGHPAARLIMVGITGTSGKTTTSLLIDALLAADHPTRGLFGTLVYRAGSGSSVAASRTTPEATDLQPMLARLAATGGTAVTMECSSHALVQDRLTGCTFDVAVFTNLSRDHLDYHLTLEEYFAAKARLFALLKPAGVAVINADDASGARLLAMLPAGRAVGFSLNGAAGAALCGTATLRADGLDLAVTHTPSGRAFTIRSPLIGRPNAENLMAAALTGLAVGVAPDLIAAALGTVACIPGRMERVPNARGVTILVDYAHKPGALVCALETGRALAVASGGALRVVFGCGGQRDRGKRPEMGRAAVTLADDVIITSDNPRDEDPQAIFADIRAGVDATGRTATWLPDRRAAIAEVLRRAVRGDVVILAGKGHETTQLARGVSTPFDDRVVAAELLAELPA